MLKLAYHPFSLKIPFRVLDDYDDVFSMGEERSNLIKSMILDDERRMKDGFEWFTRDSKEYEMLKIFSVFLVNDGNGRYGPTVCVPFAQRLEKLNQLTFP